MIDTRNMHPHPTELNMDQFLAAKKEEMLIKKLSLLLYSNTKREPTLQEQVKRKKCKKKIIVEAGVSLKLSNLYQPGLVK